MDWAHPNLLLLVLPALALLVWADSGSSHPMSPRRRRWLLMLRAGSVLMLLMALAGPASEVASQRRALALVVDHSQSMGSEGLRRALQLAGQWGRRSEFSEIIALRLGRQAQVVALDSLLKVDEAESWQKQFGDASDYAGALELAQAAFGPGLSREILLLGDGHDTASGLQEMARQLALTGTGLSVLAVSGPLQRDVRVVSLQPSQQRITEGASLELKAELVSTVDARAEVVLYENSLQVQRSEVDFKAAQPIQLSWQRHPQGGGLQRYRVAVEASGYDALPDNNDALALVEVRGRLRLLLIEGEPALGEALRLAMAAEGIELELRQPDGLGNRAEALMGYDAVILSDIAAHRLGEPLMAAISEYVERLGGGLIMLGGPQSFGLGGYYRTPIDELLPLRLQSPDEEEKQSAAVALVMDRSGSMMGQKLEMAKAAAMATAAVLGRQDWLGVFAFDNEAKAVVPMTRLTQGAAVTGQIAALNSGGGTHLMPAFEMARSGLLRTAAKVRHMIILTDGQTAGSGYESLASQCRSEGVTISTVAIGEGSHLGLLQAIAGAGGGQSYTTLDAAAVMRIFTQDTLMHTGRMIREEPFNARQVETHPMLDGLDMERAPALLGYVRTTPKVAAQVLLQTDRAEPLLAHWRHGLGKVTAFTSDAKTRWGALWLERWPQFGRFWAQVLRETARPVQGRHLDLSITQNAGRTRIRVEALADAATRLQDAQIQAEWFLVSGDALAAPMRSLRRWNLPQVGAGLYESEVQAREPGMYLVRVRYGAEMLSAGWVHRVQREASLGTVNQEDLALAAKATGGQLLQPADAPPKPPAQRVMAHREHWPWLLGLALMLWFADLLVRRWEHVQSLLSLLRPLRAAEQTSKAE